jgi:hypothetical protein
MWFAAVMAISALILSVTLTLQIPTSERAIFPAHNVLVAYADDEKATAVGAAFPMPDGSLRLHVYTVYRHGNALSGGRTPAYSDEWLDFDCGAKSVRIFQSSFYRPNGDTVEDRNTRAPFVSVGEDLLRERQLEAACGSAERLQYDNYFLFMEAYGLNDGRTPRSQPGPQVR